MGWGKKICTIDDMMVMQQRLLIFLISSQFRSRGRFITVFLYYKLSVVKKKNNEKTVVLVM